MNPDYMLESLPDALPASEHAERTILGVCMRESDRLIDLASVLAPADFSLDSHKRIYQTMLDLYGEQGSFDFVVLSQRLRDRKELDAVGGFPYVLSLEDGIPRNYGIDNYVRIVKDKALRRVLLAHTAAFTGRVYSEEVPALEIASWGISELSAMADRGGHKDGIYEAVELAVEAERNLITAPPDMPALPTGLGRLDEMTNGGIRQDELWIIGASPSRGKTTLARQIVAHTVCRGIPAYVQSGEMSRQSWFNISACLIDGLPTTRLREPRLMNSTERNSVRAAIRKLAEMPMYISDPGGIHIDQLIYNAKREKQRHGIRLLVVDYAQIVKAPGRDRLSQVSEVADQLRLFAHDEKVATVLLSQMARPEGKNLNARPNMFGLKETGRLEEAADTALLLYRPVNPERDTFTGDDEIIIGKQRNGAIGRVDVTLNGQYLRFEER
jgi:replicative DNA helicase